MINRRLTFAFTALAVAACTEADGPLTTGIYQLEVSALSESCDAPAPSGVFEVALARTADGLNFAYLTPSPVGAPPGVARAETDAALAFSAETQVSFDACTSGRRRLELVEPTEAPDLLDATFRTTWTEVTNCAGPASYFVVPEASCQSVSRLRYELREPCEAPCQVESQGDALVCRC